MRFDTYPGGMLKHGIDSSSRVIFPQKVYIIPGFLGHIQKSDHHMCFVAPINFDDQNGQFHMFEAMHTLSCSLHCALKARIKQMLYLCLP